MSKLGVNTKLNTKVDLSKVDSHNQSSTSSSATTTTTDNSDRSDKSNTNIGTGDHSSRTYNRSEIRSDSNEVKHDTRISTADSSINYHMAPHSIINIQSPHAGVPAQFVSPAPQFSVQTPMSSNHGAITSESTNTGLFGKFGAFWYGKKPVAPFDESLDKPQIIETNMSEDMQEEVIDVLCLAHLKLKNTKDRGIFIRDKLNNIYSHEWHCIIGTELDGCCIGQDGHYMQLKYKGHTYVIFKTPSPQLQVEMIKKVDLLTQDNEDLNTKLNEYMKNEKILEEKIEEIQKKNQNLLTEKNDVENKNSELIDENTNLSAQNESMKRELEEAKTILEDKKIVEAFRKKENLEDDKKRIMTRACYKGDIEVVSALLDLGYVRVNDRVYGQLTGLVVAVWQNRANVVSLLLDRGADVNLRDTHSDGWTPLMYAAAEGSLESAKVIVTRGADKTIRSTEIPERTALEIARYKNKQDMIHYLISVGVPEYKQA